LDMYELDDDDRQLLHNNQGNYRVTGALSRGMHR
jgi:hypothetical protein